MIVPAYNAGATIASTVRSVLQQSLQDFELVVVDDGSTDDTAARVEELQREDARVRLVRQENAGVAAARNAGIAASKGPYVAFVDSDDLLLPSFLELSVGALKSNPQAAIAFSDAWILDDRTRRIQRATLFAFARYKPAFPLPTDPLDVVRLLVRGNFILSGSAAMVRRSALERVGGFNGAVTPAEDWEMWLRIIARGYGVARLPRPYVIYRDREVSLSSNLISLEDGIRKVYEVVLAEYDLPGDIRAVAEEELEATRERLVALRTGRPRSRLRRALSAVKQRLLWRRYFYARVPTEIAAAFPDLARL